MTNLSESTGGNNVNTVLATVLNSKISVRCGKGDSCEFYNKHDKVSGCYKFDDRRKCSLSMKQRRKAKNKSKRCNSINWYGC